MTKPISLAGQRFGHLTALTYVDRSWRCQCDCGEEVVVHSQRLGNSEVTSCGCQPQPKSGRVDKKRRLDHVKAVVELLEQTPLLTSRELAQRLGFSRLSMIGVMSNLSRQGIVEAAEGCPKGQGKQWRLLAKAEAVITDLTKVLPPVTPVRRSWNRNPSDMGGSGITEEDRQWMQHYRAQYQQRYRRSGQIPPITRFT